MLPITKKLLYNINIILHWSYIKTMISMDIDWRGLLEDTIKVLSPSSTLVNRCNVMFSENMVYNLNFYYNAVKSGPVSVENIVSLRKYYFSFVSVTFDLRSRIRSNNEYFVRSTTSQKIINNCNIILHQCEIINNLILDAEEALVSFSKYTSFT